jgi:hypothetical protein
VQLEIAALNSVKVVVPAVETRAKRI